MARTWQQIREERQKGVTQEFQGLSAWENIKAQRSPEYRQQAVQAQEVGRGVATGIGRAITGLQEAVPKVETGLRQIGQRLAPPPPVTPIRPTPAPQITKQEIEQFDITKTPAFRTAQQRTQQRQEIATKQFDRLKKERDELKQKIESRIKALEDFGDTRGARLAREGLEGLQTDEQLREQARTLSRAELLPTEQVELTPGQQLGDVGEFVGRRAKVGAQQFAKGFAKPLFPLLGLEETPEQEEERVKFELGYTPTAELTKGERRLATGAELAGTLGRYAATYAAAGPTIERLTAPITGAITGGAAATGTGLGAAVAPQIGRQLAATLVKEGIKDIAIGTPQAILESLSEGKRGRELAQDAGVNMLFDVGANAVFFGLGKTFKYLKELKNAKPAAEAIEQAIQELPEQQAKQVIQEQAARIQRDLSTEQLQQLGKTLQDDIQPVNVNKLSLPQLVKRAEQLGLDPTGTKAEIRTRIKTSEDVLRPPTAPTQPITQPITPTALTEQLEPRLQVAEARIETPELRAEIQPQKLIKDVTPIDTKTKVLTETPKTAKMNLSDKAERVYQEIFATNLPFEKIGGKARTLGSNLNRVQGTIEYNIIGKQTDNLGNEIGKSVVDIYSQVPKAEKQGLFDYMLNKHNVDRFREGKPIFGETVDEIASGNIVKQYDSTNPEFNKIQQETSNYFKNLMDQWAVKSGLVSEETAKLLQERYPNYVPTYRLRDLPKTMTVGNQNIAQVIKKAKGSERLILPIDQQMIALTDRTIKNARKNELMNTIATAFEEGNPNATRYIKEIKPVGTKQVDDILDIGKNLDEIPVLKGNEYAVNFYVNGEPRQMIVNKTLYKALETATSDTAMDTIANTVKKYATNPFKNLITGYNPIFAASNILRDIPTALIYSSNPIRMIASVPNAVKEMLTNGEKFKIFKAMGGTREGLIGAGREFRVPNLDDTSKLFKAAKKASPIKLIGDINNFTETLPRFSEFLSVLKKTNDPALAIYRSAELTTDFSRHGKLTKYLDNFVPYLNPSVQGIDKFFRSVKESPLKTLASGAAVVTVPTIIIDQINKDDPDYNNLPPRERNLYFNIPYTDDEGNKKFIRIPKSRELGVAFSSIYEWAARASRNQEVTGKEIASAIEENFTPTDITAPIWTPALKAWRQIKDPEAYETNYWGGLIVPQKLRKYSPGEQYDANSSGIAKAIGQQFEISPYVVDYLIKSYGGIIGQVAQPASTDLSLDLITPLKKKFITDPVFKDDSVNKFYETLDKAKKEAQDYNKENNIPSEALTPLERRANILNKVSTEMSNLRKQQRILQKEDKDQEVKDIQLRMNKLAEEARKWYLNQ